MLKVVVSLLATLPVWGLLAIKVTDSSERQAPMPASGLRVAKGFDGLPQRSPFISARAEGCLPIWC